MPPQNGFWVLVIFASYFNFWKIKMSIYIFKGKGIRKHQCACIYFGRNNIYVAADFRHLNMEITRRMARGAKLPLWGGRKVPGLPPGSFCGGSAWLGHPAEIPGEKVLDWWWDHMKAITGPRAFWSFDLEGGFQCRTMKVKGLLALSRYHH